MPVLIWQLLGMLFLLNLSAFFSCAETALFSLTRFQTRRLTETSPPIGKLVIQLLDHPRRLLATILLGNTLTNTSASVLGFDLMEQAWPGKGAVLTIPLMIVLLLLLGEILPKTFAIQNPERMARWLARPIAVLTASIGPVATLLERMTNAVLRLASPKTVAPTTPMTPGEYRTLLRVGAEQGAMKVSEDVLLRRLFRLREKTLREVMTPRVDIEALDTDTSQSEMIDFLKKNKHRRVPVYDGTPDNIVGVLNARKFLFDPTDDWAEQLEMPSFVPGSMSAAELLQSFQQHGQHIAIVVDEFGGTDGLVTVEDLLEEIFGDITDEFDQLEVLLVPQGGDKYLVYGHVRLETLNEQLKLQLASRTADTIGGLMAEVLGALPQAGTQLSLTCPTADGKGEVHLLLTAQKVSKRRVAEVLLEIRSGGESK